MHSVSSDHNSETYRMQCSTNNTVNTMILSNPHQEIFVHLNSDFKYMQISMKIGFCYSYSVYSGNRFITGIDLDTDRINGSVPMNLHYITGHNGLHAYQIDIESSSINFKDTINTSSNCGQFQGYRVKAIGAYFCVHSTIKENYLITTPKSINHQGYENGLDYEELRRVQSALENSSATKTINDLHRWATGAYVMAICFTLAAYILYLFVKLFQRGVYNEIQTARTRLYNANSQLDTA
ncbi:hypothetical protein SK128_003054 [Halocaridina rubra]|uniref:Uncharacterized protein n=1 Tax=Halocaridina rubra TaxID=373956 RepID=A0AAN8WVJ2_HALRR